ncbi:TonB-dependent receptor plug domain-containing protein [candidate division WOR-3 bacterium]|uniref:TonB-dependent receptor plug domain-containing protein n=1 Tax=candidate division WOR-3 bacterium TaxID=2052148 RepID=A0A9D5KAL1_UNCW3|nr:TonB-dependent receptor plug domain-containing protein [candidate division WOR-3 bacterium]MBD3365542.1 TonB-dependent receptor plug domain-containing protein [candidate division WOR-3 bacterium]
MKYKRAAWIIGNVVLGLFTLLHADPDPSGKIAGRVLDASTRSPLSGAAVSVLGEGQGSYTEKNGVFIIREVTAGTYSVEASMIGYRSQVKPSVVVEPGKTVEVVFRLSQGAVEVGGVTVRPDFFPKVKDAPVSERSFLAEEIQGQPGGSGDISRVVQAMPAVVSSGDQMNEIIVRGGNPNENLFLIDGIEIPYPNHFGSFVEQGGPINMLNPLLIQEMDFIAGAMPARFGERASSVMDISLKRGLLNEFAGNIDFGIGGLGTVLEGPLPGKVGSFIGAYHKSFLAMVASWDIWGMTAIPYYDNYFGKVSVNITPSVEISAVTLYGDDHIDIDAEGNFLDDDSAYAARIGHNNTSRFVAGVGLQTLFGDAGYGKLLLFGASTHWHYDEVPKDNVSGSYPDTFFFYDNTEQSWGARYDATLRWTDIHETQAGVISSWVPFDYTIWALPDTAYLYFYDADSNVTDSVPMTDSVGNPIVYEFDVSSRAAGYKLGGYLQHKVNVAQKAYITLGARADYYSYTDKFYVSPRIGLSTETLFAGFSLNAGYGWHYQPPSFEVLVNDTSANHYLESRRSDHYVVGIERLLADDIKLSLEGYYKQMHNMPIPEHWTTEDPYDQSGVYLDIGEGSARGVELFVQKRYNNNWYGTLSYSLSDSRITNFREDSDVEIPADYDYRHVFTTMGGYKFEFYKYDWYKDMPGWLKYTVGSIFLSDEADLGFRFRYMGGRPYTPQEWVPETRTWMSSSEELNSERYPAYHRLDLRWDHKFIFERWSLSWYLEVQNVYNRENVWWYWYGDDGEVEIIPQFKLFPNGGLVINF